MIYLYYVYQDYIWIAVLGAVLVALIVARIVLLFLVKSRGVCPRCGGNEWRRLHRNWLVQALTWGTNIRRFACANRSCGWKGMRRKHYPAMMSVGRQQPGARSRL
jgi:hypothetical protein